MMQHQLYGVPRKKGALRDRHYAKAVLDNPWLRQIITRAPKQLQPCKREDGRWTLKGVLWQPPAANRSWDEIDDDIGGGYNIEHFVKGDALVFDDMLEAMKGVDRMLMLIESLKDYDYPVEVLESMAAQPDPDWDWK
jgi:hypothetical protein